MSTQATKKGYYGWTIVGCSFSVIVFMMAIRGAFASFIAPMGEDLGWSASSISLGLSLFMFFYGVSALFAGANMDKYGPRPVFTIHGILLGIGIFASGFSKEPWQFYLTYGLIGGIGAGAFFAPPTALVRKWFIKGLGLAMGLTTAGVGVALAVGPLLAMTLIQSLSWQSAMKIFGVVLMVGIVIVAQFTKKSPESIGLTPPGYEEQQAAIAPADKDKDPSFTLAQAVKTLPFWMLSLAWFGSNFGEFSVMSQSLNYVVKELGFIKTSATWMYALIGLFYAIIGPVSGILLDRLTVKLANNPFKARKIVGATMYTLAACSALLLALVKTPATYIIYCIFFGLVVGTYIPAFAGQCGTLFGRTYSGRIWGTVTLLGMGLGAGVGPYYAAWIFDTFGTYTIAFYGSAAAYLMTAILCATIFMPKKKGIDA